MDLPPGKERGWRKLSTFQDPLADLEGGVGVLAEVDGRENTQGQCLEPRTSAASRSAISTPVHQSDGSRSESAVSLIRRLMYSGTAGE